MKDEDGGSFDDGKRLEGGIRTAVEAWCEDRDAAKLQYGPIASWNTSEITNMEYLFYNKAGFNEDISRWDVSNVTSLYYTFWPTNITTTPTGPQLRHRCFFCSLEFVASRCPPRLASVCPHLRPPGGGYSWQLLSAIRLRDSASVCPQLRFLTSSAGFSPRPRLLLLRLPR